MAESDTSAEITEERPETPSEPLDSAAMEPVTVQPAPAAVPHIPSSLPATYHIALWTAPVSYLCLNCAAKDLTHEAVLHHVMTVHHLDPTPTPLAADFLTRSSEFAKELQPEEPADGGVPSTPDAGAAPPASA